MVLLHHILCFTTSPDTVLQESLTHRIYVRYPISSSSPLGSSSQSLPLLADL